MYYVYVLRSLKNKKRYVGFTQKAPEQRLKEHNSGSNDWTRRNKPFDLLYAEHILSRKKAILREKYFKSGAGRRYLDKLFFE
jgi:putative endonuclease